jgi:hypothetical protein
MKGANMSEEIITFPTRMKVKMRGRSISEMRDTLRGFRNSIVGSHTEALKASTIELVESGDYPEERIAGPDGTVNWGKATSEDRIFGIIAVRRLSYSSGNTYKMQVTCGRCDKEFVREVDLRTIEDGGDLLKWEFEDEEDRESFKHGIPFEGEVGGKLVKWRMLYGDDELLIEKIGSKDPNIKIEEIGMNMRIVDVEGIHRNDVPGWIKTLGDDWITLNEMMNETSAGVDLMVDGKCPWCNASKEYSVPFDVEFWVPAMQTTKLRRDRRRAAALEKQTKNGN